MPSNRKPKGTRYRFKQRDGIQSEQELHVRNGYPQLEHKPPKISYVQYLTHLPDVLLGEFNGKTIYIELKEYLVDKDCAKYEAIVESNPNVEIWFLIADCSMSVVKRLARNKQMRVEIGYTYIPEQWLKDCGVEYTPEQVIPAYQPQENLGVSYE